ncbi:MAG: hypothetical protein O3B13_25390 [Planctomycetota bacterium]|nr:hypothetical protein [Planctomycetota bacterium]
MDKTVGVFSFGRRQSQRCPDKLLRPFADTNLARIMLTKLAELGPNTFFAGYEDEFRTEADAAGVAFVRRDKNSVSIDEPILDILSFLRDVDYDYLLWVNPCLPLLETQTIRAFLDDCIKGGCRPTFPVFRRKTHFLRQDLTAVNFDATVKTLNTKTLEPILEMVHAFYFYDRRYFLDNGAYWAWSDARVIELSVDQSQFFDIDEEHEFAYAEQMWKVKHRMPVEQPGH